jgi:hypothetical protein
MTAWSTESTTCAWIESAAWSEESPEAHCHRFNLGYAQPRPPKPRFHRFDPPPGLPRPPKPP